MLVDPDRDGRTVELAPAGRQDELRAREVPLVGPVVDVILDYVDAVLDRVVERGPESRVAIQELVDGAAIDTDGLGGDPDDRPRAEGVEEGLDPAAAAAVGPVRPATGSGGCRRLRGEVDVAGAWVERELVGDSAERLVAGRLVVGGVVD